MSRSPSLSLGLHSGCARASMSPFKIGFQNGSGPKELQTVGNACRAELAARSNHRGVTVAKTSSVYSGKNLPLCGEREFAEKFSPVIEDMNIRRISKATGRSVETVKAWRARRAFPNGASLINAARTFPSVKAWLLEQINDPGQPASHGDMTQIIQALDRLSEGGPYAGMAKAILQEMHKPRGAE